jgi:hypothetical protein
VSVAIKEDADACHNRVHTKGGGRREGEGKRERGSVREREGGDEGDRTRELQCPSSIGKDLERTEAGRGMRRRRAWNSTLAWVKIIATSSSEEKEASLSWWMASPPALSLYETL